VRIIFWGALLLSASGLSGCSPSVPSWAVAATKSQYLTEKPLVARAHPTKPSVSSEISDTGTDGRKIKDAEIHNIKVDEKAPAATTSSSDDPRKALMELDQRQAEENRKIDAALAICHC
jgi:hypothetical protein